MAIDENWPAGKPGVSNLLEHLAQQANVVTDGRLSETNLADTFAGPAELVVNVKRYGARGDGTTDDGAAIEAALAALVAIMGSDSAAGILHFPPGRFIDSMQHTIPTSRKIVVQGSSRATTEIRRANGSTGDWWTFDAVESGIQHITLDGRRYQCPSGGDNIVLNGAYSFVYDVFSNKASGDGIAIGKTAAAIVHHLDRVRVRECLGYGIRTYASTGSTDGIWNGVEVGLTGKSGVRLDTGSQNIVSLHAWGCGLEDASDKHGVYVNSQSNTFLNVQSETNNGFGVYCTSARNVFVGGRIWGNMSTGLRALTSNFLVAAGIEFYRNAAANAAAGSNGIAFSAIYITDTLYHTVSGNNVWDDTTAISAVSYVTAPTFPFPGRTAARSQAYGYTEDGTSDYGAISGNTMPRDLMRGSSGPYIFSGGNHNIRGNQWGSGVTAPTRTVVSGAVRVPAECDVIYVSAGSTITSVLGHFPGRHVTLLFNGSGTGSVTDDGDTLNLAGNLTTTPGVTLSLVSDGSKWREISRSAL